MTSKELIKLLKKNGWKEKRQTGSHKIFAHKDFPQPVPVPFHSKDLKPGTLANIMKRCGLK